MIGHFPEGETVTATLLRCRRCGLNFDVAWRLAIHHARKGRLDSNPRWHDTHTGLLHAYAAFRRAYEGDPPTREDQVAKGLLDAMTHLYDDSQDAETTALMEAA